MGDSTRTPAGSTLPDPPDVRRWLDVLVEEARASLPAPVLEYVLTGARDGVSAAEAEAAWSRHRLVPRVLHDVTHLDLGGGAAAGLMSLGTTAPFGVAPTTLQRAVHPDGELAVARACAAAGLPMVVSSNAGTGFAEIGATGVTWWVQCYLPSDRALALPLLERAVAAGARGVVLTVDTPVVGTKYAAGDRVVWDDVDPGTLRVNFDAGYAEAPGSEKATDLGPHDLGWLATATGLPVVVKGVLHPDDAERAVHAGATGVWVSTHGGRQLDRARSTAASLSVVGEATRAALPGTDSPRPRAGVAVLVDGGVRSGLDLLTALALGADAVMLGRPVLLALVRGEEGVATLLARMRDELEDGLRLAGCRTPAEARALQVARA